MTRTVRTAGLGVEALCASLEPQDSVLIELWCGDHPHYTVLCAPRPDLVRREIAHARKRQRSGDVLHYGPQHLG